MSVTFTVEGRRTNIEAGTGYVNLANANARDFLTWLGLKVEADIYGRSSSSELAALCRRRLWPERHNEDPGREGRTSGGPGTGQVRFIDCGREPGYLHSRARVLLALCETSPDGFIIWG